MSNATRGNVSFVVVLREATPGRRVFLVSKIIKSLSLSLNKREEKKSESSSKKRLARGFGRYSTTDIHSRVSTPEREREKERERVCVCV